MGAERLSEGCWLFKGVLRALEDDVLAALEAVLLAAPARIVTSPHGIMSVQITSAGEAGWYARRSGYGYVATDPVSGKAWPAMPEAWLKLAERSAGAAGFNFTPDTCLVNVYQTGTKLGLHRDEDEIDFRQPIVSLSLGLAAAFAWGGLRRNDPVQRVMLEHGDVLVFGGPDRMRYHAITEIDAGEHPKLGARRVNLTFRKAR